MEMTSYFFLYTFHLKYDQRQTNVKQGRLDVRSMLLVL